MASPRRGPTAETDPEDLHIDYTTQPGELVPQGLCVVCKHRAVQIDGYCASCAAALGHLG